MGKALIEILFPRGGRYVGGERIDGEWFCGSLRGCKALALVAAPDKPIDQKGGPGEEQKIDHASPPGDPAGGIGKARASE